MQTCEIRTGTGNPLPAFGDHPEHSWSMSDAFRWNDLRWWGWVGIALFLIAELSGLYGARFGAIAIGAVSTQYYLVRYRCFYHFPTQVYVAFFAIMTLSCVPYFGFIMWFQLAGTLAHILFGYSFISRAMVLLPGNRSFDLDWQSVMRVFLHRPTRGSIRDAIAIEDAQPVPACQTYAERRGSFEQ